MPEQLDIMSVFKLKVDELKNELGQRNLAKTGSKPDLQERLLQYVTKEVEVGSVPTSANNSTTSADFDVEDVEDTSITKELADVDADVDVDVDEATHSNNDLNIMEDCEKLPAVLDEGEKSEIELADLDTSQELNDDVQTDVTVSVDDADHQIDLDIDVEVDDVEKATADEKNESDSKIEESPTAINNDCVIKDSSISEATSTEISTLTETTEDTTKEDSSEADIQKVKIVTLPKTDGDKKVNRSKRFGEVSSETEKKKARFGRFSTVAGLGKGQEVTEEDVEKIKKRAERFGAVSSILTKTDTSTDVIPPSTTVTAEVKTSQMDRLKSRQERFADSTIKKRQERFGVMDTQSLNVTSDMEARKQNRLAKFGKV